MSRRTIGRGWAAGTCALVLAFFGTAGAAYADSLAIHSPADGSIHSTPPTDITGDSHDDWFVGVHASTITGQVQRKFPDNTFSGPGLLWYRSFLLCACSDWALSDGPSVGTMPTADGQYRIRVTQQGLLVSDDVQTSTYTIDTQAPDTTIDLGPNEYDNDSTPVFEFSGTDPDPPDGLGSGIDRFECSVDGGAFGTCVSGDPVGPLDDGEHTLEVRAVDKAGNVDPSPSVHEWAIDTVDPEITVNFPPKERFLLHAANPGFSCDDPLSTTPPPYASGIDTCGSNGFNNEDLGPHKLVVDAEDRAGNTAHAEVAYVIDPPHYSDFLSEDDPVAYYRHGEPIPGPGDDRQSVAMVDSSGNGHHGTYKNDVALGRQGAINCARRPHPPRVCETASEPEDRAAFFPERDGYGYVNGIPSSPTGYSMEAWVKPRTAGPMMVMSHGRAGQLFIDHNQRLAFEQSQDTVSSPGPNIPVGEWTHVAATWDGHNTRLYVNGVQVAHSTTANKPPSGTSTFYVGYGEKAPWFHGEIDESALYDHALSAHRIHDRNKIGRATDKPSLEAGNSPFNTEGPFTDPVAPKNGGVYAPNKTPDADFECTDPDDAPGDSDIASCTAEVDGDPIADGDPLPDDVGTHMFIVTATDEGGNTYVHPHQYEVKDFSSLYGHDNPVAYFRLGDGPGTHMQDSSPHHRHGEYKNDQDQGPVGIAGDGDTARDFRGAGGYGYANGIPAPRFAMTLEAWIEPDDWHRDQSIAGHGDGGELYLEGGALKFRHGPQNRVVTASPPYAPNPNSSYTQVVGTWDGVDLRIYVNGQLEGTVESNRGPTSNSTFYVGFGEVKPWFDGRIDEVAYYGSALNPNRVYQHFIADPAADSKDGGSGSGNGGSTGGTNGGGSGASGGGGGGSAGDGSAGAPAKLGLRLGKSVTPAGRKAMVPLLGGDEPSSGTITVAAGKTLLGKKAAHFSLEAGEDGYVNVKLSKKGKKTLRKQSSVIVTVDADTGVVKERVRVSK